VRYSQGRGATIRWDKVILSASYGILKGASADSQPSTNGTTKSAICCLTGQSRIDYLTGGEGSPTRRCTCQAGTFAPRNSQESTGNTEISVLLTQSPNVPFRRSKVMPTEPMKPSEITVREALCLAGRGSQDQTARARLPKPPAPSDVALRDRSDRRPGQRPGPEGAFTRKPLSSSRFRLIGIGIGAAPLSTTSACYRRVDLLRR